MAGLCEGGNDPPGFLKAKIAKVVTSTAREKGISRRIKQAQDHRCGVQETAERKERERARKRAEAHASSKDSMVRPGICEIPSLQARFVQAMPSSELSLVLAPPNLPHAQRSCFVFLIPETDLAVDCRK
ncbi:hypothetical protein ANN_16067 [Periplaneta americana]|uniref:Uncharacterized protein n=1 Tax=Periplaneta americana TaxID=6978 RepID=A0ABQ8SJW4_PERAM|nr:hypothetical protein ANN_16067 [Periplaneta americana]